MPLNDAGYYISREEYEFRRGNTAYFERELKPVLRPRGVLPANSARQNDIQGPLRDLARSCAMQNASAQLDAILAQQRTVRGFDADEYRKYKNRLLRTLAVQ